MYDIFHLMEFIQQCNGSDLHLSVGRPPTIRVSGRMRNVKGDPLTPDDTIHLANQILPPRMKLEFREKETYKQQADADSRSRSRS